VFNHPMFRAPGRTNQTPSSGLRLLARELRGSRHCTNRMQSDCEGVHVLLRRARSATDGSPAFSDWREILTER
jgi:hypothetical protein